MVEVDVLDQDPVELSWSKHDDGGSSPAVAQNWLEQTTDAFGAPYMPTQEFLEVRPCSANIKL